MYTNTTPLGTFNNGNDYRQALIEQGYKDMGWMNGWSGDTYYEWEYRKTSEPTIEDLQWNRSGSDCTYVLHQSKIFCSVDMGD